MKCGLVLLLLLAIPCHSQTPATGQAQTKGPCSPAVSGHSNTFVIKCGIDKAQGREMLAIINKILANELDPNAVMAKLDEILAAVNPNRPAVTYSCEGRWQTAGPGVNAAFEVQLGGDDSAFKEMLQLNNSHQFAKLLEKCMAQISSVPEWLTPRLFCGMAYLGMGDLQKAKDMLTEFDSKTGPAYDVDGCQQMSDFLHKTLQ